MTCPVKWRERRGRKVEEFLYNAEIKSISENNEELELKCVKLAEELALRTQSDVGKRKNRKRKRTEKGRDWDSENDRETRFSGEQPCLPSASELKAGGNKKKELSKKKSPLKKKDKRETLKSKERKIQKITEIASRQSLVAKFFGTIADNEKQGGARDKNTPIITVNDHDCDHDLLPLTNKQMIENRKKTDSKSSTTLPSSNSTFAQHFNIGTELGNSSASPSLAPPALVPAKRSATRPRNTSSPRNTCSTPVPLLRPVNVPSSTRINTLLTAKSAQNDAESLNINQKDNHDLGRLFRSSLSLAYGDDDDLRNIAHQPDYSYLEDLNEDGPHSPPETPTAANSVSRTCANCEVLKKEIEFLKRNQVPEMSPPVKQFLLQLLASGTDSVHVYQETSKEISSPGPAINENVHAKHFLPRPGKQELGSGVYISKVEIQNIHIEAGKRPTQMLKRLLGYFFELRTLALQRENLDDKIVHACSEYAKRCATVWKISDQIDYAKIIRNKRGSAKRKLERQLAKKETVN